MTVLHLIRPESGPWPEEIAVRQAEQGDRVVALRWREGSDDRLACDVVFDSGEPQSPPATAVTYDALLDLLLHSHRVCCW